MDAEFKSVSFVIVETDGKTHRVAVDKIEGEHPEFILRGNPELLLKRWELMSKRVEMFLMGRIK